MADRNLGLDINPGGTRLAIAQIVSLMVAWTVCGLRAYVKFFMKKKVLLEDWLMFAALLIYTAYGVIDVHGIATGGTGKHTADLTLDGIAIALRAWYLCEVLYPILAVLIRTSIALFLLRLAAKPWHVWVIWGNLAVIWVISTIYFFLLTFQCTPPSYFWRGPARVPGATGSCMNHNVVPYATIVHTVLSAVSDWILGLLPIPMLWDVKINRRTKIGIATLLGMGLIAGIALVARIPYIKRIAISADFLFETTDLAVLAVVEPSLGILAGCITAIRPLFKHWGFTLNRSRRNGSKQSNSGAWRRRFSRGMRRLEEEGVGPADGLAVELREAEPNHGSKGVASVERPVRDHESGKQDEFGKAYGISVRRSIDVRSHSWSSVDSASV